MYIHSENYRALSIFTRKSKNGVGILTINDKDYSFRSEKGEHLTISIEPNKIYKLTYDYLEIKLVYLHDKQETPEIKILYPSSKALQYRYHFSPPCGWLNDPNGLSFFKGWYHMFYQFNPMDACWGNAHWGHARSKDLVHWEHLPVVLYPQDELGYLSDYRGGAYSGTAYIEDDTMNLFFTRHIGDNERTWCMEIPKTSKSKDGISFSQEKTCFNILPVELSSDFRDPKVMKYDNGYIMLTGTRLINSQEPAVSVHFSTDMENWEYKGIFYKESDRKYLQAECPDLISDGTYHFLIVGYHNRNSETLEKRRDVNCYVGHVNDFRFISEKRFLADYGKDFYASQSIAGINENIIIGWINDMTSSFINKPGTVNGAMALPRKLSYENGKLKFYPIKEVLKLFSPTLPTALKYSTNGSYFLSIFGKATVQLAESEKGKVTIKIADDNKCIITIFNETYSFTFIEQPIVDIFFDIEVFEIYVNKGEKCFTRRFCMNLPDFTVRILDGDSEKVSIRQLVEDARE